MNCQLKYNRTPIDFFCALVNNQRRLILYLLGSHPDRFTVPDNIDQAEGFDNAYFIPTRQGCVRFWWRKGGFGEGSLLQLLFEFNRAVLLSIDGP